MTLYYHTTRPEKPALYHTNRDCDEGKKIKFWDLVDTNRVPGRRHRCQVCRLVNIAQVLGPSVDGRLGLSALRERASADAWCPQV
jgi:hypothetical protein